MSKYLLCCPHGGFNDQISVIYTCYNYCKNTNRILLVYTNCLEDEKDDFIENCLYSFDFTKYIHFDLDNIIFDREIIENIIDIIDDIDIKKYMSVFNVNIPKKLQRFISNYNNNPELLNQSYQFLLNDYSEKIIGYFNCGGIYNLDINFLNKFFFKEPIKTLFYERIKNLPSYYVSFHIRNTDYKSDYKKIIEDNIGLLSHPIYLATDSIEVLNYINSISKNKIYQFTKLNLENKPLHNYHHGVVSKDERFIDLILDLLCVANSNIFVSSVGGFSFLCNKYFENKSLIQFY